MIVDTHVHVMGEDQVKYPRRQSVPEWVVDMPGAKMLSLMREAGIDRTVLVQAFGAYAYDNSYAADCAAEHPGIFTSVCILNPLEADGPDELTYWVKERGVRGLRIFTITGDDTTIRLDDPKTFPLWERAGSLGIPICVITQFKQLGELRAPLERFPNIPVALDHVGMPRLDEGAPYGSIEPLFAMAKYPNVYLKFSSVTMDSAQKGKSTPRDFFRILLDRFGARRMMWGSNFPATHDRPLKEQLQLAQRELAFVSEEDRRWLFGETALTLWPMLR